MIQYEAQLQIMRELNLMIQERAVRIDKYIEYQRGQIVPLQSLLDELKGVTDSAKNASDAFEPEGTLSQQTKVLTSLTQTMNNEKGSSKKAGGLFSSLASTLKKLGLAAFSVSALSLATVIKTITGLFKVMKFSTESLFEFGKGLISLATALMGVISALYSKLIDMAHELMSGGSNAWAEAIRETKMHFGALNQAAPNAAISMAKDMSAIPEAGLSVYRVFGTRGELLKEFMTDYVKKMEATFEIFAQEFADSKGALLGIAKGMGYSGEEMNTLAVSAITKGHPLSKEMVDTHNAIWKVAKPFGVSTKLISRDVAKAEKNVKSFGAATKESLVNAVTSARILGIDFEKLDGLMDTFSSIESSTEAGIKLFQAFEVEIDPYTLLRAQETGTVLDHLRDQFKKRGVNSAKFNRANIGLLASVTGLSAETARQALSLDNAGKTIDEIQDKQDQGPNQVKTLSTALKELADSIEFKVFSGSMPKGGFLDMWLEGIYSQMFRNKHFRGLLRDIGKSLRVFYYEGTRFFNAFMEAFPGINRVVQSLRTFFNPKLFKTLIGKIYGSFNKLFIGAKTGTYGFSDFMSDVGKAFEDHLDKFNEIDGGWLYKSLYESALSTSNIFGKVFGKIGEFLSVGIRFVAATIRGDRTVSKSLKKIWKGLKKEFGGMFDPVIESIGGLVQSVGDAAKELEDAYNFQMKRNHLESFTTDSIYDTSKSLFEKAAGYYAFAKDKIGSFFHDLKEKFAFYWNALSQYVIPAILAFVKWSRWYAAIMGIMMIGDKILSRLFPGVAKWISGKISSYSTKVFGKANVGMSNAKQGFARRSGVKVSVSEFELRSSRVGYKSFFDSLLDFRYKHYPKLKPYEDLLERVLGKGGLQNFVGLKRGVSTSKIIIESAEDLAKLKSALPTIIESLEAFKLRTNPTQVSLIDDVIKNLSDVATGSIPTASLNPQVSSVVDDAARASKSRFQRFKERAGKVARFGMRASIGLAIAWSVLPLISDKFKDSFNPKAFAAVSVGLNGLALYETGSILVRSFMAARAAGTGFMAGLRTVVGGVSKAFVIVTVVGEGVRWIADAAGWDEIRDAADFVSVTGMVKAGYSGVKQLTSSQEELSKEALEEFEKEKEKTLKDPLDEFGFIENQISGLPIHYLSEIKKDPKNISDLIRVKNVKGRLSLTPWTEIFSSDIDKMVDEYMPLSKWAQDQRAEFRKKIEEEFLEAQETFYNESFDILKKLTSEKVLVSYKVLTKGSKDELDSRFRDRSLLSIESLNKQIDESRRELARNEQKAEMEKQFGEKFSEFLKPFNLAASDLFSKIDKFKNYSYKDEIIKMAEGAFNIMSSFSAEPFVQFMLYTSFYIKDSSFINFHDKFYNFKKINETLYEIVQGGLSETWDAEETYESYSSHLRKNNSYFSDNKSNLSWSESFSIQNVIGFNLKSSIKIISDAMSFIQPKMYMFVKAYTEFEQTAPFLDDLILKFIKEYGVVISGLTKIQSFAPEMNKKAEIIEGYCTQPETPSLDYTSNGVSDEPQMSFNLYQELFIKLSPFRDDILKIGTSSILKDMAGKMKVIKPFLSNVIDPLMSILRNISDSIDELLSDKTNVTDDYYYNNRYIANNGQDKSGISSPFKAEPLKDFSPFFQSVSAKTLELKRKIEDLKGKTAEAYFKSVKTKMNKALIKGVTISEKNLHLFSSFSTKAKGPFFDPKKVFDPVIELTSKQTEIESAISTFSTDLSRDVEGIVVDLKTHFGKVCEYFFRNIEEIFKAHNEMISRLNEQKDLDQSTFELNEAETSLLIKENAPIKRNKVFSFDGKETAPVENSFQINVEYIFQLEQKANDFANIVFFGSKSALKDRLEIISQKRQWKDEYKIKKAGANYSKLSPLILYSQTAKSQAPASGAPASAPVGGK
jgi:hypothetical protein